MITFCDNGPPWQIPVSLQNTVNRETDRDGTGVKRLLCVGREAEVAKWKGKQWADVIRGQYSLIQQLVKWLIVIDHVVS